MIIEHHEDYHEDFKQIVADISRRMRENDYLELSATVDNPTRELFADSAMIYPYRKFIACKNDKGVAVGGVAQWYSGVGVLWLWATDDFPLVAIEATRKAKKTIQQFFDEGGHRVECMAMESHSNARRWIEALGLELEHVKRATGKNKEDFYVYSKVI